MENKIREIAARLCCPDDEGMLRPDRDGLTCTVCARVFPILDGPVLDLLPTRPATFALGHSNEYASQYLSSFQEPFHLREGAMAWGAAEISEPVWAAKRERQVRAVLSAIVASLADAPRCGDAVVCDISAGGGHYTRALAPHFKWVLHCDLSVDSLSYAARKSAQMGISNMLFLRVDYLRLPFLHSLDRVVCFDTLIRGTDHEQALLAQIRKALRPAGAAMVDFHNWWHNPLRRLGVLRENFVGNRSYARAEAEALLRTCGIDAFKYIPFCQEFDRASGMHRVLSRWIPPARLMFEFSPNVGSGSSTNSRAARLLSAVNSSEEKEGGACGSITKPDIRQA